MGETLRHVPERLPPPTQRFLSGYADTLLQLGIGKLGLGKQGQAEVHVNLKTAAVLIGALEPQLKAWRRVNLLAPGEDSLVNEKAKYGYSITDIAKGALIAHVLAEHPKVKGIALGSPAYNIVREHLQIGWLEDNFSAIRARMIKGIASWLDNQLPK